MPPVPKGAARPRAMRRARRRRTIRWGRLWGTLLVLTLLPAPAFSPAMRIRRALFVGAAPGEAPAAEAAVRAVEGDALATVNATTLESAALADGRWRSVRARRVPPGEVRLEFEPRVPVAMVVDEPPLLLDASGVIYDRPRADGSPLDPRGADVATLPRLTLGRGLRFSGVALAAPLELRRLGELASAVRLIVGDTPVGIEVRERGLTFLSIQGSRVILGSLGDLEAKLAAFRRVLARRPTLLREASEINLMAADRPSFTPRAKVRTDAPAGTSYDANPP